MGRVAWSRSSSDGVKMKVLDVLSSAWRMPIRYTVIQISRVLLSRKGRAVLRSQLRQRIGPSIPSEAEDVGAVDALSLLCGLAEELSDEGDEFRQGTMTAVGSLGTIS